MRVRIVTSYEARPLRVAAAGKHAVRAAEELTSVPEGCSQTSARELADHHGRLVSRPVDVGQVEKGRHLVELFDGQE